MIVVTVLVVVMVVIVMMVGSVDVVVVVVVLVVKGVGSVLVLVVRLVGTVLEFWNILGLSVAPPAPSPPQQTFGRDLSKPHCDWSSSFLAAGSPAFTFNTVRLLLKLQYSPLYQCVLMRIAT